MVQDNLRFVNLYINCSFVSTWKVLRVSTGLLSLHPVCQTWSSKQQDLGRTAWGGSQIVVKARWVSKKLLDTWSSQFGMITNHGGDHPSPPKSCHAQSVPRTGVWSSKTVWAWCWLFTGIDWLSELNTVLMSKKPFITWGQLAHPRRSQLMAYVESQFTY